MHIRGIDIAYVEQAVGEKLVLDGFDKAGEKMFIEVPSKTEAPVHSIFVTTSDYIK